MLSVVIPSRVPDYLQPTVDDLLAKAEGDIEVIVVLDGYYPAPMIKEDARVKTIHQGTESGNFGMRSCINAGMRLAVGEYVMKIDEHCMFDQGYDKELEDSCRGMTLCVPRRYRFNPDKWERLEDDRPPIDYMFLSRNHGYLHGWRWDEMYEPRKHMAIDEVMTIQGSCWFMPRIMWDMIVGPLDDINYGPFSSEAQEVSLKVWLGGGRCIVNKNTWYAHYHKPGKASGYRFTKEQYRYHRESIEKGRKYCTDFWMNNRWEHRVHDLEWLVEKFKPVPTWHKGGMNDRGQWGHSQGTFG